MSTEPPAPIRGRYLAALRACAAHPEGLRHGAYPSAIPALVALGFVEERRPRSPRQSEPMWFLTQAGRNLIRALGPDEVSGEA